MTTKTAATAELWYEQEYNGAPLPDARLVQRQLAVGRRLAAAPAAPYPQMMVTDAELEAFYRFVANPDVTPDAILAPHRAATRARAAAAGTVLALHDTTEFDFTTHDACSDLGRLRGKQRGFLALVTLLVARDAACEPLGVAGLTVWTRRRRRAKRHLAGSDLARLPDRESQPWRTQTADVAAAFATAARLLHVYDRAGDAYPLLADHVAAGTRFVARVARDRVVVEEDEEDARLSAALADAPVRYTADVTVASRDARPAPKSAAPRDARVAHVEIRARAVTWRRPAYLHDGPDRLDVHVVSVVERDPPPGTTPVAWVLVTTEPLTTVADVRAIVAAYDARWQIEVFFDALKNGCHVEDRRLQRAPRLYNALALALPVAWQLLRLRAIGREESARPAAAVVSPTQLAVLCAFARRPLPADPTAADVVRAIAGLGGNLRDREPGWRVLARGLADLMRRHEGWIAAKAHGKM